MLARNLRSFFWTERPLLSYPTPRCISKSTRTPAMASPKHKASADDAAEDVASTAVPGKQSTEHFPKGERPNACKGKSSLQSYESDR